jgi:hypothetical protein
MSPKEFVDLVCKMRSAQKQYFRTRLHDHMQQAKELERQVDQALRDFSNPKDQLSLFP